MVRGLLILLIRVYRSAISPAKGLLLGPFAGCRFYPSCSEYALEALKVHGALRGSVLTLKRLLRCHPWGGCGWDPVPGGTNAKQNPALCCESLDSQRHF